MNDILLWAVVFGPVLLAEGLLARYEVLAYGAGWRTPTTTLPDGVPYARGAAPGAPPKAYLVYLDGIGKRRIRDSRDGGELVKAVIARAPELRVLGQVQPYSPLADPLADRPVWAWLRRHLGLLLFLHNVMQVFVAADHRYRPLYNRAVGSQITTQLRRAGYQPGTGIPIVLLSYSGGAQVATGALDELHTQLRAPLLLIMFGAFHNGANDLTNAEHVHELISASDRVARVGTWIFPQRWPLFRRGGWNGATRAGKLTVHRLDPATHVGPGSYISPTALLPDGRSYLDRTADEVIAIIRGRRETAVSAQMHPPAGHGARTTAEQPSAALRPAGEDAVFEPDWRRRRAGGRRSRAAASSRGRVDGRDRALPRSESPRRRPTAAGEAP
ncbi:hypothetical protein [Streptomyces sp. ADI93-02]|uniref:hypothetical protein n=1 Tax=Streptomyces sp. ADI93-02 TaxID=1522757 RepID=UPI000FB8054C|nr:hypothetical protein [Streptomyces sp. ADI93-02]RPK32134.1 hypothetical protein EES40_36770 [Streptomyces sp. ADI93-02]